MAGPLFHFSSPVDCEPRYFQPFDRGYILPLENIHKGQELYYKQFLSSILCGSMVYSGKILVGYYFSSRFNITYNKAFVFAHLVNKSKTKECNKIFASENIVILEYPNCGTLAISPDCNPEYQVILDEQ